MTINDNHYQPGTSKCDKSSIDANQKLAIPLPESQSVKFEVNVEINITEAKSNMNSPENFSKIEKTDEEDIVNIESLDNNDEVKEIVTPTIEIPNQEKVEHETQQIEVELRSTPIKKDEGLSTSVPNQRTLWPHDFTPPINRGSLSDMLASNFRRDHREWHSMSTSSTMRQKEETIAMIRGGGSNSCSKDTLLFIDQQNHNLMDDDYLSNRSLWVSSFIN